MFYLIQLLAYHKMAHVNHNNLTSFVMVDAPPFNVHEFNIITYLIISFNGLEPISVKFLYSS